MFIFTFVMFFIFSSCKTDRSFKNFDSCIKQNLTLNASLIMNNRPCFGSCVLNIWDSNFSFIDRNVDEITYKIRKSSISTHHCTTLLNNYQQQERRYYQLLNSNSSKSSNLINGFSAVINCQQHPVIWLCEETKSMISNILILNFENNIENYHLVDKNPYTHHRYIFLADQKKYHFLFNETRTRIHIDKSNHQAHSITFKGRRLLSHVYYDAEDEESKSATQSHTKDENHDEKLKNNELETEDDYGDDLYDDDDDDADEEEENQEDVLYEEEPVPLGAVAAKHRERLSRRRRRVARTGYKYREPQQRAWLRRRRRKSRGSYRKAREDCEDLGTTPVPYYRDYDPEEDIDLSSAETSAPLLKLVCSLAVLTLLDFIY